ncbi:hypothetical protein [Sorangium sp. So ce131]|uniref:hypothetical protein n=1 Tax=Sorangium sp. So ce131 TaxID=3133282 RepID=UPI003F626B7D
MDLNLFLAHAEDGAQVFSAELPPEALPPVDAIDVRPRRARPPIDGYLGELEAPPDSLSAQRWGVILAEGRAGDLHLDALAPLIELRQAAQKEPVRIFRVPSGTEGKAALDWVKDTYQTRAIDEEERPRYLLLAGDLAQISLDLQQILATVAFPGRIAFPCSAQYRAYAGKVVRWEHPDAAAESPQALFALPADGTPATSVGLIHLLRPCLSSAMAAWRGGRFAQREPREITGIGEDLRDELLEAASARLAGVLVSVSHGSGPPRDGSWPSPEAQRREQGALSLGHGVRLGAADVASGPFLPGGLWLMFACFGAGTPPRSAYHHWLTMRHEAGACNSRDLERVRAVLAGAGEHGFLSALALSALSNPEGPLAVIGHMDLAWTNSFLDPTTGRSRSGPFWNAARAMLKGSRAGVALDALTRAWQAVNDELADMVDAQRRAKAAGADAPLNPVAYADRWLARNDLRSFVLLGDPAARLALRSPVVP